MACVLCGEDQAEPYGSGLGLTVEKEREPMPEDYELTERTYTDPEKTRIVPENHPGGGILLGIAGDRIPAAEAERLGLTKSGDAGPEPDQPLDRGAGAATSGRAKTNDKAVPGPKE